MLIVDVMSYVTQILIDTHWHLFHYLDTPHLDTPHPQGWFLVYLSIERIE